jgi:hypothetical protein
MEHADVHHCHTAGRFPRTANMQSSHRRQAISWYLTCYQPHFKASRRCCIDRQIYYPRDTSGRMQVYSKLHARSRFADEIWQSSDMVMAEINALRDSFIKGSVHFTSLDGTPYRLPQINLCLLSFTNLVELRITLKTTTTR